MVSYLTGWRISILYAQKEELDVLKGVIYNMPTEQFTRAFPGLVGALFPSEQVAQERTVVQLILPHTIPLESFGFELQEVQNSIWLLGVDIQ